MVIATHGFINLRYFTNSFWGLYYSPQRREARRDWRHLLQVTKRKEVRGQKGQGLYKGLAGRVYRLGGLVVPPHAGVASQRRGLYTAHIHTQTHTYIYHMCIPYMVFTYIIYGLYVYHIWSLCISYMVFMYTIYGLYVYHIYITHTHIYIYHVCFFL